MEERAVCGSGVLWTFFWLASVHRVSEQGLQGLQGEKASVKTVSEQECSSRKPSLDCGAKLPCSDGRGGFLDDCCLIQVALPSAFQ
eukprot:325206-Pelagomonas_calceolata.AAC.1